VKAVLGTSKWIRKHLKSAESKIVVNMFDKGSEKYLLLTVKHVAELTSECTDVCAPDILFCFKKNKTSVN
jgi:hypothetical protein